MDEDKLVNAPHVRRIVGIVLALALLAAIVGLIAMWRGLSAAERERAQLAQWQAGILGQLNRAMRPTDMNAGTIPLTPADAPEALAEVIASRDSALQMLSAPKPYALGTPEERAEGARPAAAGAAKAGTPEGINQLLVRQSTGTAADDANSVEQDSQAPWKGWQ